MGSAVFAVETNFTDLRAYGACAPGGGLTVAFINFSNNVTATLDVHGPPAGRRALRVLSSADNVTVALNGVPLVYAPGSGALPALEPAADAGDGPLLVAPRTLGFVSWPDARAYDC